MNPHDSDKVDAAKLKLERLRKTMNALHNIVPDNKVVFDYTSGQNICTESVEVPLAVTDAFVSVLEHYLVEQLSEATAQLRSLGVDIPPERRRLP